MGSAVSQHSHSRMGPSSTRPSPPPEGIRGKNAKQLLEGDRKSDMSDCTVDQSSHCPAVSSRYDGKSRQLSPGSATGASPFAETPRRLTATSGHRASLTSVIPRDHPSAQVPREPESAGTLRSSFLELRVSSVDSTTIPPLKPGAHKKSSLHPSHCSGSLSAPPALGVSTSASVGLALSDTYGGNSRSIPHDAGTTSSLALLPFDGPSPYRVTGATAGSPAGSPAGGESEDEHDGDSLFSLESTDSGTACPFGADGEAPRAHFFPSLVRTSGDYQRPLPLLTPLRSTGTPALQSSASQNSLSVTSKPVTEVTGSAAVTRQETLCASPPPALSVPERSVQAMLNEALLNASFDARATDHPESRARLEEKVLAQITERGISLPLPTSRGSWSAKAESSTVDSVVSFPFSPRPFTAPLGSMDSSAHAGAVPASGSRTHLSSTPTPSTAAFPLSASGAGDNPLAMPVSRASFAENDLENPLSLSASPSSGPLAAASGRSDSLYDTSMDNFVLSVAQHLGEIKQVRRSVVPRYFRGMSRDGISDSARTRGSLMSGSSVASFLSSPRRRRVTFHEYETRDGVDVFSSRSASEHVDSTSPTPPPALSSEPFDTFSKPHYALAEGRLFLRGPFQESNPSSSSSSPVNSEDNGHSSDNVAQDSPGTHCLEDLATSPPLPRAAAPSHPSPRRSILVRSSGSSSSSLNSPAVPSPPTTGAATAWASQRLVNLDREATAPTSPKTMTVLPSHSRASVVVQVPSSVEAPPETASGASGLTSDPGHATGAVAASSSGLERSLPDHVRSSSCPLLRDISAASMASGGGPLCLRAIPPAPPAMPRPDLSEKQMSSPHLSCHTDENLLTSTDESAGSPATLSSAPMPGSPFMSSPRRHPWQRSSTPAIVEAAPRKRLTGFSPVEELTSKRSTGPLPPVRGGRKGHAGSLRTSGAEDSNAASLSHSTSTSTSPVVVFKAITPATVPHKDQLAKRASEDYLLFTQVRLGFLTSLNALDEEEEGN